MQTTHYLLRRRRSTGKPTRNTGGKPVESPSALRHVDELMSSRSGPKGLQVERPVAPLSFADSLRELLDLVTRHPGRNPDHKRAGLKPWLSAVGAKPFIYLRGFNNDTR